MTSNEILQELLDLAQTFADKYELNVIYQYFGNNGSPIWEIVFKYDFTDGDSLYEESIVIEKQSKNDSKLKAKITFNEIIDSLIYDSSVLSDLGEMLELLDDLGSAYTKEKNAK